jgi:hypothetical protein
MIRPLELDDTDLDGIRHTTTRTPSMTTPRADRTFVVIVSDESDISTGGFCGRVEHIETGRRKRFLSSRELFDFVAEVLVERETESDED